MNKIAGLRTVIYKVADMQAAKTWYTKAFETTPYFDETFYIGFNIDGYELGLQPTDLNTTQVDNVVAYWAADDVPAAYDRLISLGATAHEQPQEVGGGIVVATVKDPWGNAIGLIYNPHFGEQQPAH